MGPSAGVAARTQLPDRPRRCRRRTVRLLQRPSRDTLMYAPHLPKLPCRLLSRTRSLRAVHLCLFIRFFAGAWRRTGRGLWRRPGRRRFRQRGRHAPGWGGRGRGSEVLFLSAALGAFNLLLTGRGGSEAHILSLLLKTLHQLNHLSGRPLKVDVPQIDIFLTDVNRFDGPGHKPFLLYLQDILGGVDLIKPYIPEGVRRPYERDSLFRLSAVVPSETIIRTCYLCPGRGRN